MNADKHRYNAANLRSFAFICGLINYMKIIFMQPCPPTAATPLSPGCRLHAEQPGTGRGFLYPGPEVPDILRCVSHPHCRRPLVH